jgi:hypothetical protein
LARRANDEASFSTLSKKPRPFNALETKQIEPHFVVSAW